MTVDVSAAGDFLASHARVLDRRRFELRDGQPDPAAAIALPGAVTIEHLAGPVQYQLRASVMTWRTSTS